MENEKEVNPTQSGEGEVSSSNPTDGAAAAPSTGSLQEPTAVTVLCKQCGASFERKGMNSRYCAACSPSRTTITRKKRADSKKTATYVFNSATLPTKTEAKELLA